MARFNFRFDIFEEEPSNIGCAGTILVMILIVLCYKCGSVFDTSTCDDGTTSEIIIELPKNIDD